MESNYPKQATHPSDLGAVEEISISGLEEASAALRNRSYAETYNVLREKRAFNMRLIDGALIQFRYRFRQEELVKHVLSFYPSPDLLEYLNDPAFFQDYVHPASHFTNRSVSELPNSRAWCLNAAEVLEFCSQGILQYTLP